MHLQQIIYMAYIILCQYDFFSKIQQNKVQEVFKLCQQIAANILCSLKIKINKQLSEFI